MRITHDQKETALDAISLEGTIKAGIAAAGVSTKSFRNEMNRSAIFKRRVQEAKEEGKRNVADKAVQLIKDYADGVFEKTDRNRLTAAIALANAYEPGFRGTTRVEGKVAHEVRFLTAVPRPKYNELPAPKITISKPVEPKKFPQKTVKRKILDNNGNLLAVQKVVEGEIV